MPQQTYLGYAGGLKTGVIELLDAVDENDHVIGCMSREDIHKFCLRHRAAHVLVFDSKQRLFLQKRSSIKECSPNGMDSSPPKRHRDVPKWRMKRST